ncbi:MAG: S8 family serine peptidase, partial [Lachnospiraceae bacterium]|nr:S8 family serine peptidase [Lachnospiraceae bacterium]
MVYTKLNKKLFALSLFMVSFVGAIYLKPVCAPAEETAKMKVDSTDMSVENTPEGEDISMVLVEGSLPDNYIEEFERDNDSGHELDISVSEELEEITIIEFEDDEIREELIEAFENDGIAYELNEYYELAENEDIDFGAMDSCEIETENDDIEIIDGEWNTSEIYEDNSSISFRDIPLSAEDIIVAVIDSGYTGNNNRILDGIDFTDTGDANDLNGHGSAIAKLILENTNDCVKILPLKVTDAEGRASLLNICRAIDYCCEVGVDVINISMCAYKPLNSALLNAKIAKAKEMGIAVIVAAGNASSDVKEYSPGNCPEAFCVGACNEDMTLCDYSNFGEDIDFLACGTFETITGTSVSAAVVTALYAEVMLTKGGLSVDEIKAFLSDATAGTKVISVDGIDSLFESEVCESAALFCVDFRSVDIETFNNVILSTPEATVRRYLLNLSEDDRNELASMNTVLSNEEYGYTVAENITEDENTCVVKHYDSYIQYLLENEFETSWYCSSSTKTGYFYVEYRDATNNSKKRQKISVKLTNLPTSDGNKKGSIKVTDSNAPKSGAVGYTLNSVEITKAEETNYIYIGIKFKLNIGSATHYSLTGGKDSSTINESQGGGGLISINNKSSISCTGSKNEFNPVVFQISFYNTGISVTGGSGDTGKHGVMYVKGAQNSYSWKYSTANSVSNGKREYLCKGCNSAGKTEYLNYILLKKQKTGGTYTEDLSDTSHCKKLNMDGSSFSEKKDINYYSAGATVPAYTASYENSVYMSATLPASTAVSRVTKHELLVPRKQYTVIFQGNGATAGSMASQSFYFNQTKSLSLNQFSKTYSVNLYANGGTFSDSQAVRKLTAVYQFANWCLSPIGNSICYGNGASVSNLPVAGTSVDIGTRNNGEVVNLYALWSGGSVTLPTDVTRLGYKFVAWGNSASATSGITGSYTATRTVNLYAIWKPQVVKITLDTCSEKSDALNQGTSAVYQHVANGYYLDQALMKKLTNNIIDIPERQSVSTITYDYAMEKSEYGVVISGTKKEKKINRNYMFQGYYTGKGGTGHMVCDSTGKMVTNINNAGDYRYFLENAKVYADWEKKSILIFEDNLTSQDLITSEMIEMPEMISCSEGNSITVDYSEPVIKDEAYRKLYRFKGWSTDIYGSDMVLDGKDKTQYVFDGSSDVVLYANWEYPISIYFKGNGATKGEDKIKEDVPVFGNVTFPNNDIKEESFEKTKTVSQCNPKDGTMTESETVDYAFCGFTLKNNVNTGNYDCTLYDSGGTYSVAELINEAVKYGLLEADENSAYVILYVLWDCCPVIYATDGWLYL